MIKSTSASTDYRLSREAGAATVVAMAASERGDLVLGTDAGELEVLRLPARFAAYSPVGFLPPWGRPEIAEPQRVLSVRTSPSGAPVTDVAVALTPAGGLVAVAVHGDGTVAAVPAVDGIDPVVTTMPGALLTRRRVHPHRRARGRRRHQRRGRGLVARVRPPGDGRDVRAAHLPRAARRARRRDGSVIGDRTGFSVRRHRHRDRRSGHPARSTAASPTSRRGDGRTATFRLATIPASGLAEPDHHAAHRGVLGDRPGQDARTAGERRERRAAPAHEGPARRRGRARRGRAPAARRRPPAPAGVGPRWGWPRSCGPPTAGPRSPPPLRTAR